MKEREFRMNYIEKVWWRYKAASKVLKGKMLDEFCKICGYKNRKYAIRKLGNCPPEVKPKVLIPRSRKKTYGPGLLKIVESVWEEANYPWSVRLKEIIRIWLPWVKKHYQVKEEVEKKLLSISARTIDRHLRCKKIKMKRRIYGHTKPGSLLRHHIPIKTEYWDVKGPGFIEVDLVSHSGDCSEGEYIYSLNLTDIYSGWVETHAVMGKGEEGVFKALLKMRLCLPFKILGIDSDNGGEFINYHLWRYCDGEGIEFTRSRPRKKDDNAHIEQKNWTHVRKLLGWDRYDSLEALSAMNDLYRNELRIWMNLFQPSVKLIKTKRIGSSLKRSYDKPLTPLDRLVACQEANSTKLASYESLRARTDPFELSKRINQKLDGIFRLAHYRFHHSTTCQSFVKELLEEEREGTQKISQILESVRRERRAETTYIGQAS